MFKLAIQDRKLTMKVNIKAQHRGDAEKYLKSRTNMSQMLSNFKWHSYDLKSSVAYPLMSVVFKSRSSRAFKPLKLHYWLLTSVASLINPSQGRKISLYRRTALHS